MKTQLEKEIRLFLPHKPFTRELIGEFFAKKGEVVEEDNLNMRVNRLKSKGIITNISRGWYKLNDKKIFEPELNTDLKRISRKLKNGFPYMNYLLWSTVWLNDLSTLQLMRNISVIEVEPGSEDVVFNTIKVGFPYNTFLNPTQKDWSKYMTERDGNIIVKTLFSESPKEIHNGIKTAKLEKILVDIYCDKFWQIIYSGELNNIFTEACSNYAINYSTLLRYAARRAKREEIWTYIKSLDVLDIATIELIER